MGISEVQLEKIKLAVVESLPSELLDPTVNAEYMVMINRWALSVSGYIWGESGKSQTIRYPATWRDAFKERWFPSWLLARYPVTYREHEISLKTLYPNFRVSVPHEAHVLKYAVYDRLSYGPH